MAKTMFSREVAYKLEDERNAFVACIGLSQRARDINYKRKQEELQGLEPDEAELSSSVLAMLDFTDGRIAIEQKNEEDDSEDQGEATTWT